MADNYAAAACFHKHGNGYFAGESAFAFPVRVLRSNGNRGTGCGFHGNGQRSERRRNDDFAMPGVSDERLEGGKELARLRLSFVHLPVAGDYGATRHLNFLPAFGFVRKRFDAGKFFSGKKFERGAAPCGDVGNFWSEARPFDCSDGIPAANDRGSAGRGCRSHGARNGQSALSECGFLEHAHWTVPHNRAGGGNFLIEERDSLRTNVEAHQVFRSLGDVRDARGRGVGRFSENMIHRENKTEFAAARFFEKIPRKVQLVVFDQGLPYRQTLSPQKSVSHGAA